jgi:hypothetical protein
MSKLGIVGAMALSLALAVATPASAMGLHGGFGVDTMYVGSGGSRIARASAGPAVSSATAHCRQRWAYYDSTSGKYMGDDGQWRPCL